MDVYESALTDLATGNMGHRVPIAHVFWQLMGCNVLMLSYRGYGLSEGYPSEKGMRIDAQTALDYACSHALLKDTKKVVSKSAEMRRATTDAPLMPGLRSIDRWRRLHRRRESKSRKGARSECFAIAASC